MGSTGTESAGEGMLGTTDIAGFRVGGEGRVKGDWAGELRLMDTNGGKNFEKGMVLLSDAPGGSGRMGTEKKLLGLTPGTAGRDTGEGRFGAAAGRLSGWEVQTDSSLRKPWRE